MQFIMKNLKLEDIDGIAVTYGPGLVGALLVGVSYARGLAYGLDKPLVGVNHLEGHIASNYITHPDLKPPFLCMLTSGGNTQIVYVKDYCDMEVLGKTRDDAIGEAFDKVARVVGLGYPGGPKVDKLANTLFDIFIFISVICILLLQWRVNSLYNEVFGNYNEFYLGTPFLFVIYIALLVILYFGFNNLVSLVRKDETLIYYIKGDTFNEDLMKVELNNAYNDTLDDFEQFFDEHLDEYRKMEIQEVEEMKSNPELYPEGKTKRTNWSKIRSNYF